MAIGYDGARRLFKLDTTNTTYMIALSPEGYVGHVYYGRRIYGEGDTRLLRMEEEPYTPSVNEGEKASFMIFFPWSIPQAESAITGRAVWKCGHPLAARVVSCFMRIIKYIKVRRNLPAFRLLSERRTRQKLWICTVRMGCWDLR